MRTLLLCLGLIMLMAACSDPEVTVIWRGLTIAEEDRCSPYDPDDYRYPASVEARIVDDMGGVIYGPYTGRLFASARETDIEHIVARSEAHDSGLCATDAETRKQFATDILNLTLAGPTVNRQQKSNKDAAEWLPDHNQCWYADRVVRVRQKYDLSVDRPEADALDAVLSGCSSMEMVVFATPAPAQTTPADAQPTPVVAQPTPTPAKPAPAPAQPTPAPAQPTPTSEAGVDALALWDDNGNGRITCAEAREHGIAPVRRGHPAYEYMTDRDGDGIVCEG